MHRKRRSDRFSWIVLMALGTILGCGDSPPETIPVTGFVTLANKPVDGASVLFSPVDGGRPGTGTTDAQGKFQLTTFQPLDGAILGEHRVTVTLVKVTRDYSTGAGAEDAATETLTYVVPVRYSSQETSDLRATVSRESKEYRFALTAK